MPDEIEVNLMPPSVGPVTEAPTTGSLLADMVAQTQANSKKPITVALDANPAIAVRYKIVVPLVLRKKFTTLFREEHDLEAHIGLLTNQCEAIIASGTEVVGDDGKLVTFNSPSFWAQMGVPAARECLAKFYGGADGMDGAAVEIYAVANAIYAAGGVKEGLKDEQGNPLT